MAGFLTDGWLDELRAAAQAASVPDGARLVVQQVVVDGPSGEVAYALVLDGGRLEVVPGHVEDADLTFTLDRATAEAIHRGELSAQSAFLQGRLRLGGDLRGVIGRAGELASIDDVFESIRA